MVGNEGFIQLSQTQRIRIEINGMKLGIANLSPLISIGFTPTPYLSFIAVSHHFKQPFLPPKHPGNLSLLKELLAVLPHKEQQFPEFPEKD